jgi:hypothetical protein
MLDSNLTEQVDDFRKSIKPRWKESFGKGNAEICTPKSKRNSFRDKPGSSDENVEI